MLCEMRASCARPLVRSLWSNVMNACESTKRKFPNKRGRKWCSKAKAKANIRLYGTKRNIQTTERFECRWFGEREKKANKEWNKCTEQQKSITVFCMFIWTSSISSSIGDGGIVTAAIVWFCMRLSNFVLCSYLSAIRPLSRRVCFICPRHTHTVSVLLLLVLFGPTVSTETVLNNVPWCLPTAVFSW